MDKKIIFVILLMMICMTTTGCMKEEIKSRKIAKNAINYFAQKYNINKKDIKIKKNRFYSKEAFCMNSCGENEMTITYNNKEYTIQYDLSDDSFGDNYQYDEIYNDLYQHLVSKFPFVTQIKIDLLYADVLRTSVKYDGDIVNYMKNSIKRRNDDVSDSVGYTRIKIWIESSDANQAKELHEKYYKNMIIELENMRVSYNIALSKEENDNEDFAFYYYCVNSGTRPSFSFTDKVDNNRKSCNRNSITFEGNILKCN